MLRKKNPTIRQINRYLDKEVTRLLDVHERVSNPDFEAELQEVTGIAWKQVKNYKNHPKPNQRVRDNAKVLKFALERQSGDYLLKGRNTVLIILALIPISISVYLVLGLLKPTKVINNTHIYKATTDEVKKANRESISRDNKKEFKYATLPIDLNIQEFHRAIEIEDFLCSPINSTVTSCFYSFDGNGTKANSLTIRLSKNRIIYYDLHLSGKKPVSYLQHQLSKYKESMRRLEKKKSVIGSRFIHKSYKVELTLSYFPNESRYQSIQVTITL